MQVISDLHGGDPDDIIAKAEFEEIKERVMFEVRATCNLWLYAVNLDYRERMVKVARMQSCGSVTKGEFYSQCHLKLLLNW